MCRRERRERKKPELWRTLGSKKPGLCSVRQMQKKPGGSLGGVRDEGKVKPSLRTVKRRSLVIFGVIEILSPEEDGLGVFDQRQELVQ